MSKVLEVREEKGSFDLLIPEDLTEMYVDGMSQGMMGSPISKIVFHVTTPPEPGTKVEQRKAVLTLAMGTHVLLEMCENLINAIVTNERLLADAQKKSDERWKSLLAAVKPANAHPDEEN